MPNKKGLLTRKEIGRYNKADLLRIARDSGIACKGKMLKRELVDCIFKRKDLRSSLQAPPKRKMTEKQKANLLRLNKRDYKDEKKIKQKAQVKADQNIIQDTDVRKSKIKPRYVELKERNKEAKGLEKTFKKADEVSNDLSKYHREMKKQENQIKDNLTRLRKAKINSSSLKQEDKEEADQVVEALNQGRISDETSGVRDQIINRVIERAKEMMKIRNGAGKGVEEEEKKKD